MDKVSMYQKIWNIQTMCNKSGEVYIYSYTLDLLLLLDSTIRTNGKTIRDEKNLVEAEAIYTLSNG